uniref:Uncharacterized protein n=1 Tax=Romanomermis culicivorax TaxID=13658 RepID=A0A915J818_ROMCU
MWVLDISKLTLKFPAPLCFFNNPAKSFLQSDILAYAALDAYYLLLLFLAFSHYGFVPKVYNAPALFPHNSLDATEIDHLAKTIITAFHDIALSDVLPANSTDRVYPTISQIALPVIMQEEVLSAYKFFMFDCTSSDHGRSFCLGTVPNCFRSINVLVRTTHPKLLTAPKKPKKKKKKQKDEWNKLPDVSDDEDPALQPRSMFKDPKRLQAAFTSAMKSGLTDWLIESLNFPVLPMHKLAIRDCLHYKTDTALPPIWHKVDDVRIKRIAADQSNLLTKWMNRIPAREPSFARDPGTYVCNQFALCPIIFDEEFHIETSEQQIDIDESDYRANPHSHFHFYSILLNVIDFQN